VLPVWRNERGFRLQLGDEVRAVMAAARHYQAQAVAFPQDEPGDAVQVLEHVDEVGIRKHLVRSLPVGSLLDWLQGHYGHLQDATLLRLFHDLQHESDWQIEAAEQLENTTLQTIRILHHPHRVSITE
jgi:outer membrane biogenesis lipoprotein LolB